MNQIVKKKNKGETQLEKPGKPAGNVLAENLIRKRGEKEFELLGLFGRKLSKIVKNKEKHCLTVAELQKGLQKLDEEKLDVLLDYKELIPDAMGRRSDEIKMHVKNGEEPKKIIRTIFGLVEKMVADHMDSEVEKNRRIEFYTTERGLEDGKRIDSSRRPLRGRRR
ncbi:hypothetical protein KAW38_00315 [Candidatus Micrarchaeota archaeon]|nr:hypothetical protein [Candidatus Micrarchaeota archaeon]